jgi:phospholipid N-methyltransferase
MEATRAENAAGVRASTNDRWLFAKNFLRHPHMLGSAIPSSRFLVNAVLAPIDWSRARVIVEYGPGVGTFTAEILRRMRSDARLLVIETHLDFVRFIDSTFADRRLSVEHDSAENVQRLLLRHGLARAGHIVSGIPLGSMPKALQSAISVASRDALEPGGVFHVYQFTHRVLPVLRDTFPVVQRGFELRNIPPGQWFRCSGNASLVPLQSTG